MIFVAFCSISTTYMYVICHNICMQYVCNNIYVRIDKNQQYVCTRMNVTYLLNEPRLIHAMKNVGSTSSN
jgi:hypothetical protein